MTMRQSRCQCDVRVQSELVCIANSYFTAHMKPGMAVPAVFMQ